MDLVSIDPDGPEPASEQVRRQVAEAAASGTLAPGHRLPPVRRLAETLDLAPNTVARAYRLLEADGIVETHGRGGTLIATRHLGDVDAGSAAGVYVREARGRGLSLDEALRLVEQHWV